MLIYLLQRARTVALLPGDRPAFQNSWLNESGSMPCLVLHLSRRHRVSRGLRRPLLGQGEVRKRSLLYDSLPWRLLCVLLVLLFFVDLVHFWLEGLVELLDVSDVRAEVAREVAQHRGGARPRQAGTRAYFDIAGRLDHDSH